MPSSRLRRLLATHGWLVAIAAAYLYVFPYYPRLNSANELPRAYAVRSIVVEHTFAIDREVQKWGRTYDLSQYPDTTGPLYQNKAPGSSLLVVPVYALVRAVFGEPSLGQTIWLCRVVTGVIPTLVLLWLLWGFLERFTPDPLVRRTVLVAYACGSMAMTYSLLYYGHQLSAVLIASAWLLATDVADRRRGLGAMAVAGLLAGAAPLVDYEAAFAGVPVAVYIVWKLRTWPRRELARAIGVAVAAAAVPIAVLLWYHATCFAGPLDTPYAHSLDREHTTGLLGLTHPMLRAFVGITVAPDNGLVALAPWWLLAIPGGIALWRRGDRATVMLCTAVAVIYIAFGSSLEFWRAGWEVGPRYIVAMQAFLLPLVAVAIAQLRERPWLAGLAAGALLIGIAIYTSTSATLPYWPGGNNAATLRDPLYEVTFRLLADRAAAPSLGSLLGLPSLVGVTPFVAGIFALAMWAIAKVFSPRALVIGIAVTVAYLLALAFVPHGGAYAERAYAQTLYPAVLQQ